jgi:hypothetical protein
MPKMVAKKMINVLKKYLYISLGLHLLILITLIIISNGNNIKQPFVVFGAYSKKNYHTLYKSRNSHVPFLNHGNGNGNGKHGSGKAGSRKHGSGKNSAKSNKNKNLKSKLTEKAAQKKSGSRNKKVLTEPKSTAANKIDEKKFEKELKKIELEEQKEIDREIKEKKRLAKEKSEIKKQKEQEKQQEKELELELKKLELEQEKLEQKNKVIEEKEQVEKLEELQENKKGVSEPSDLDDDDDTPDQGAGEIGDAQGDQNQENFIYTVGVTTQERTEYYKHVRAEIEHVWTAPLNIPKGTSCKVKFFIDMDGNVEKFETVQKSNVIIYDLSILRIAHLPKFHKCLWGKCFVVDFCQ